MIRKTLLTFVALPAAALVAVSGQAQTGWKKFGKIAIPSSLILLPHQRDWTFHDNMEMESADKKLHLSYYYNDLPAVITEGGNVRFLSDIPESQRLDWVLKFDYNGWLKEGQTNYSVLKENWFVVSGTYFDSREFYIKAFFFPPDEEGRVTRYALEFSYPASERGIYDPVCARIMQSFTSATAATPEDESLKP